MTQRAARQESIALRDGQFSRVVTLVQEKFGIVLAANKRSSVARRLVAAYQGSECSSFEVFFASVLGREPDLGVLSELIDLASTNHTYFWREPEHFQLFANTVLPQMELRLRLEKDLRIWCAAAATGEEPVTLAILLKRHFGRRPSWRAGVLATDISAGALAHARAGVWKASNVLRLPHELREDFHYEGSDTMKLSARAAALLTWRRLNLVAGPFPFRQQMHVVFCRNVLIYFDLETRKDVLSRIHDVLVPGGWLFLSHSETIGRESVFEYIQPGVYRRRAS